MLTPDGKKTRFSLLSSQFNFYQDVKYPQDFQFLKVEEKYNLPELIRSCASCIAGSLRLFGKGTPSVIIMAKFSASGLSPFATLKHSFLVTRKPSGVFVVAPT